MIQPNFLTKIASFIANKKMPRRNTPKQAAGTHEPEMFTPWKRRIILQIIIFRFRDNLVGGKSNIFGIFTPRIWRLFEPILTCAYPVEV